MARKHIVSGSLQSTELLFERMDGLVTVVAQEYRSRLVLMVAYATYDAVVRTLSSGYAHYYSRSRREIWEKGATSGNRQRVRDVLVDCDADALLYIVEQIGDGACHTGAYSCFYRRLT